MNINQVIYTIQGEGLCLGKPSLLIRTQGCNLKCPWCDSKHSISNKENNINLQDRIAYYSSKYKFDNIMITGGEPFLQIKDVLHIINQNTHLRDKYIEIETNGTKINKDILYELNQHQRGNNITLNISPKFDVCSYIDEPSSFNMNDIMFNYLETISLLNEFSFINYTIKFVYEEVYKDIILKFINLTGLVENNIPIFVMTKTSDNEMNFKNDLETVQFCKHHNLIYTPRIHLPLFGKDINEEIKIN